MIIYLKSLLKDRHLFTILLVLFCNTLFAQIETNNWYFGKNAGLDLNDNQVNILYDGAMSTPAGCSSISDWDGNLLFYTNGLQVWNQNHVIMEGSTEQVADISGNQSAIIVPKPNDPNVYYIFSTIEDYITTPRAMPPGMHYAEVVFSPEFPLGKVTHSMRINITISSRLTAIHHAESNTIRVIGFGRTDNELPIKPRNTFYIFNVTEEGVQIPAITKTVDQDVIGFGGMKISPDGQKIALIDDEERFIYLYDFNNETLDINYDREINPDEFMVPQMPYSVEFSQDSKNLFYSIKYSQGSRLYQFGLTPNGEFSERFMLANIPGQFGTLQLASNGKIYVATYKDANPAKSNDFLSVINEPEKLDDKAEFELDAIDLNPGASIQGLPNFVASFLRNRILTEDRCVSEVFDFDLDAYTEITNVEWDFGDGATSSSMTPTHQFTAPGKYVVKAMITINGYPQPLYENIEVFPLPSIAPNQTLKQCDLDNDGISNFNLNTVIDFVEDGTPEHTLVFYNSLLDAQTDTDSIPNPELFENATNPQELFVKITSPQGCVAISNFFIETTFTTLDGIPPMYTCEGSDDVLNDAQGSFPLSVKEADIRTLFGFPAGSTIGFYASSVDAETKTNPLPDDYITSDTTIWVRVDNEDFSCNGISSIQLIVNDDLGIEIQDEYLICNPKMQPPIVLDGGVLNDRWEWSNSEGTIISTNREFTLLQPGIYSLTVYRTENGIECSVTKQFVVTESEPPVFDEIIAENQQIFVSVIGQSDYEFSLDDDYFYGNGTSHTFYGVEGGIYTVYVRDRNKCELPIEMEVALVNYPSFFTPNQDGFHDRWKIDGISNRFYFDANVSIYDRYGKLLHSMDLTGNQEGWDGSFNGNVLLATDYWFRAVLTDLDGKSFTKNGHFSLMR